MFDLISSNVMQMKAIDALSNNSRYNRAIIYTCEDAIVKNTQNYEIMTRKQPYYVCSKLIYVRIRCALAQMIAMVTLNKNIQSDRDVV